MEVGLKDVVEEINAGLNHVETVLRQIYRDKADKWEMRVWFMTIMALLGTIPGTLIVRL